MRISWCDAIRTIRIVSQLVYNLLCVGVNVFYRSTLFDWSIYIHTLSVCALLAHIPHICLQGEERAAMVMYTVCAHFTWMWRLRCRRCLLTYFLCRLRVHTPQARWLFLSCNYFKCKKYMWFFFLFKRFKIIKLSIMVLPITDISQIAIIMTSPTSLGADAKAQTPNKKQQQHAVPSSNVAVPSAASSTEEGTSMLPPPETPQFRSCGLFSWMKVFRYADLMLRQGC